LLGGPPGPAPLADALARGIAGVLVAERFDRVITDLGAGPELAHLAVGGVLNPAELCVVVTDGSPRSAHAATLIEAACHTREVRSLRLLNRRGEADDVARELAETLAARSAGTPP
jgi:hypothetical protein